MDAFDTSTSLLALSRTTLTSQLEELGMCILGGFHPEKADQVPPCQDNTPTQTLLLIGNAGSAMWHKFQAERLPEPDPMDSWVRRNLVPLARNCGFDVMFPFDGPPFLPFQSWGERAGAFFRTPAIPSIHPKYGTWFGLRAAFLAPCDCLNLAPLPYAESPCDTCVEQPCLHSCPGQALSQRGHDIFRCVDHTNSCSGHHCIKNGCQARHNCPVGQEYAYVQAQAEFHMRGFVGVLDKFNLNRMAS